MKSSDATPKRRSQILLDEDQHRQLVEEARVEGRSVSALVREAVAQWLAPRRPRSIQESPFWALVGKYHSGQTGEWPISEHVDDYLYPSTEQGSGDPLSSTAGEGSPESRGS